MTDSPATPASPNPVTPGAPAPKKRSVGKIIKRTVLALLLILVVGIVVLYLMRNSLVRAGVMYGGKYATEQETLLDAADLSLGGTLDLSQLQINNPTGYQGPFLKMKACNVKVQPGSLLSSEVVVESIAISGLDITVEQNGMKNNLAELMDIMKKKSPAASAAPAAGGSSAPPASPGKQLKITCIDLAATKVHLRVSGLVPFNLDLDLGPIHLDDITNPDGRPMKIADVIVKVLLHVSQQITQEIANNPKIPNELKNGLKDVTALVDNLKGNLNKSLKGGLGKVLKDATKNIPDLGKQIPGMPNIPAIPGIPGLPGATSQPK